MKRPYTLIPDTVSTDTVECLRVLLARAKRGEVVGLAYCAMLKQKAYIVNTAGIAHESPTFALGCVAVLSGSLSDRINNRGEQ